MAKLCKFGVQCTRADCWFSHPADCVETTPTRPCKEGAQCTRADCCFSHPTDRVETVSKRPCKDGAQCTRAGCWFGHPNEHVEMTTERPCKDGAKCTRADCWFSHPADRVGTTSVLPCRDGECCTRRDCRFGHPPDRPDPNSEEAARERCSRSLLVGRLSSVPGFETTDEILNAYFGKFGELVVGGVVRVNKDKNGKSRGFGLVEFRNPSSADQAMRAGHPFWSLEKRKFGPCGGTFLVSTNRSQHIAVESEEKRLHPHDIRFTHGRISFCFKDGTLVDETINKCMAGTARFEDVPPLHVVLNPFDGCFYSLSNRRLFVARVLSSKGFRFGLHRESDSIGVRLFPFSNEHVQAQWTHSCRTMVQGGRFAVSAWRCGTCTQTHASNYIEEQIAPQFIGELRKEIADSELRKEISELPTTTYTDDVHFYFDSYF